MNRAHFYQAVFLSLLCLTGISIASADEINEESDCPIRFAVIGDRTGSAVPGIYEQIVGEIERLKPDFVVTVGDMIEGPENDEQRLRAKWAEYDSIISRLSMPIYLTPGNNDIESDFMEDFYPKIEGRPYHSFDVNYLHFIILDNSRWSSSDELPGEQLNWLIDDLVKNIKARFTFVFYHKPFWETSIADGAADTLHTLFRKYGVDAVFSGHYHTYLSGKYDDILYTVVGSSGGGISHPGATGLMYHFVWVTVDKNGISIAPIKMGAVLPWDEVTADENNFVYPAQLNSFSFPSPFIITEMASNKDTAFRVDVRNSSREFILEDTIRWKTPTGWRVEPQSRPVAIPPDTMKSFSFSIQNENVLYPVPEIAVNFPYAANKKASAQSELFIARQVDCFGTNESPNIDGKIAEESWRKPITKLIAFDGTETKTDSVKFYCAFDKDNLYIAAYCLDSEIKKLSANIREHDGSVYSEECVGFLMQPDLNKKEMFLVYFNPLGITYDQKITPNKDGNYEGDESWNCAHKVKTTIGGNYWSLEASIPVSQFGTSLNNGDEWGINMRRKQPRLNEAAHLQIPWQ